MGVSSGTSAAARDREESTASEYRLGDFLTTDPKGRVLLSECPLCAVDSDRERYVFTWKEPRSRHFSGDHSPGDVGKSVTELFGED